MPLRARSDVYLVTSAKFCWLFPKSISRHVKGLTGHVHVGPIIVGLLRNTEYHDLQICFPQKKFNFHRPDKLRRVFGQIRNLSCMGIFFRSPSGASFLYETG